MSARYSYAFFFFFQLKKKRFLGQIKSGRDHHLSVTNEERKTLLCAAIENRRNIFLRTVGFACHAMAVIALVHAEYYTQSNWCISGDEI